MKLLDILNNVKISKAVTSFANSLTQASEQVVFTASARASTRVSVNRQWQN